MRRRRRGGTSTVAGVALAMAAALLVLGPVNGSVAAPVSAAAGTGTGADPLRDEQYGLDLSGLAGAGRAGADARGTVVAVLDSGVDAHHPDLAGRLVPGIDLVGGDDRPDDENGHGTRVAGVIAASQGNGLGIAGGAPGARIMPVRVIDRTGATSNAILAEGVRWAVANGAEVINLDLGDPGRCRTGVGLRRGGPLDRALRGAADDAVIVVAADRAEDVAGLYRLAAPVIVAGATQPDGRPALRHTAPAHPPQGARAPWEYPRRVSAPGVDIVSTVPGGGYRQASGTSMAAPHVAAEAALLIGLGADPARARELITMTAANPAGDPRLGAGLIDARAAVAVLLLTPLTPQESQQAAPRQTAGPLLGVGLVTGVLLLASGSLLLSRTRRRSCPR
jgi:subtilisin family serine protease